MQSRVLLRLAACALLTGGLADAAPIFWINTTGGGSFQTGTNWSGGTPPGSADTANFGWAAAYVAPTTVTFTAGVTNNALDVQDGSTTLTIGSANTYSVTSMVTVGDLRSNDAVPGHATLTVSSGTLATSGPLFLGSLTPSSGTISGTLNINAGATVTDTIGYVGNYTSTTGTVNVSGAGATWTNSQFVTIGGNNTAGTGALNISSGGQGSSGTSLDIGYAAGSTGSVSVSGSGSKWTSSTFLTVGDFGTGSLTISNGGVVNNVNGFLAGSGSASVGNVLVSGTGSQWNNSGYLIVGNVGTGTLTISNGGTVSGVGGGANAAGYIGLNGGTGTVNVNAGSSWTNTAQIAVGETGSTGTLNVNGTGATVSSQIGGSATGTSGIVGLAGGTGTATISNSGTWTNAGALRIGDSYASGATGVSSGSLNILSGGTVSSTAGSVGYGKSLSGGVVSTGSVLVSGSGSQWTNSGTLDIGTDGIGSLKVANGGLVSGSTITVGANGTLQSAGGTLQGNVVNNGGVTLGDAPGNLTVNGNYTNNGTILFLIAGPTAANYSQFFIQNGTANFGGTIDLDFINGYTPTMGTSFDFIQDLAGGSFTFTGTIQLMGASGPYVVVNSGSAPGGSFLVSAVTNFTPSAPEPSTEALLGVGLGLGALAYAYRRQRHRA